MQATKVATIAEHFSGVQDPRVERTKEHSLVNIIVIAICGVICGADTWVDIEHFGQAKADWLAQFLDLENGIPAHDTFGRVFARLDPEEFQAGFISWIQAVSKITAGEIVAIDGKQLRRSHDGRLGKKAIYMVSAWATGNHLVLGQRKVDEKSNEITAIPKLLELLALAGCIVTIDAMGCQTEIAAEIVAQDADYVLALKGNQGRLHEDVAEMFTYFEKIDFAGVVHDYHRSVNGGHGRFEIRECWTFDPHQWADHFRTLQHWPQLRTVVMVVAQRQTDAQVTRETRFYISSLESDARQLLQAIRSHWGIENSLHWVLDIAFREDDSRIRTDHAPENMAVLRHIALNLLKQEQSAKCGIHAKRLKCAWDEDYLMQVLQGAG